MGEGFQLPSWALKRKIAAPNGDGSLASAFFNRQKIPKTEAANGGKGSGGKGYRGRKRGKLHEDEKPEFDVSSLGPAIKKLLTTLLKATANSQQRLRTLESTAIDSLTAPETHEIIVSGKGAYAAYLAEAEEKMQTEGEVVNAGPPDQKIFFAILEALHGCDIGQRNKINIKEFGDALYEMDQAEAFQVFPHCKVVDTFKDGISRISVHSQCSISKVLCRCCEGVGRY
jgi:hypothetical protein